MCDPGITPEILLANGYTSFTPPKLTGSLADTIFQKKIRRPSGHPKGLLLYTITVYMFDFRNTRVGSIHFTFSVNFHRGSKEWYTVNMHGAEDLALDQIERKLMNFYTRNGFIPDPDND